MAPNAADFLGPIEEIANGAGEILLRHFRKLDGYDKKGAIDLQTIADRESEEWIVREIRRRWPDHAILAEEEGAQGDASSDFQWIIDPLDGTTNYAHGLRIFAVSIGLAYKGQMLAGGIYAPALEEIYLTGRKLGSTRNSKPLRVSPTDDLDSALVVTGFPYNRREYIDPLMTMLSGALTQSQGVLRFGSAALDFAAVAAGNLDAFYEHGLFAWDMAAGWLLVEEAGGKVTGLLEDEPFDLFKGRLVASNGKIHTALQAAIRPGAEKMP